MTQLPTTAVDLQIDLARRMFSEGFSLVEIARVCHLLTPDALYDALHADEIAEQAKREGIEQQHESSTRTFDRRRKAAGKPTLAEVRAKARGE